jgi:hypothetical protein
VPHTRTKRPKRQRAHFTYDESANTYYFAPNDRAPPTFEENRSVMALIDTADDGTLADIQLVLDDLPPPPAKPRIRRSNISNGFAN